MKKLKTVIRILIKRDMLKWMPDRPYLALLYWLNIGKKLNLKNPQRFTEKIQWLKLYDRNPEYTKMVDKCDAKEYVASIIGTEYINPTLGVWHNPEDIDYSELPNRFVLKTTHDSGTVRVISDKTKIDKEKLNKFFNERLHRNLSSKLREWVYKGVKPRIIAEPLLEDQENPNKGIRDYKFFCFNGTVKCMKIDYDRFTTHHANYYDTDGNLLPFEEKKFPRDEKQNITLPVNFNIMIQLAEKLSKGHSFLRVDFYEVNGTVYFGELTFYPASGFGPIVPDEWDYKLGSWISLP